jgi:putrescine transport system substrate-binding protein
MSGSPLNSSVFRRAAVAVAALWLSGCGGTSPSAQRDPTAQSGEGATLNLYNWPDYIGHHTISEFERRTHIKVVTGVYDSNQTLEVTLMTGHSGYDLVSTTTSFYGRQIRAGAYLPLDRSKLPNWKNLDPAVLAVQSGADPGNRYAVPYLHSMNGIAYNVDLIKARMPGAPLDSSAMIFDPKLMAKWSDCGVTFLDSPEDVIQLALAYLHLDPNSQRPQDLEAAERVIMAVRPYIRQFDSIEYWHQLASKEICVAIAWSSDYTVAQETAREDGTGAHLGFILPKEGSNIAYNAFLIPVSAPHVEAALKFLNYLLEPQVIADITNELDYGNDNLAARPFVKPAILEDPAVYPPPAVRAKLYLPAEITPDYERLRTRAWTRIKTGQ